MGRFKWLILASREDSDGVELLLEPNDNPAARTFQKAIFAEGIPATTFGVDDVWREYERLKTRGAVFREGPTSSGPATTATLEDGCGNPIRLAQMGCARTVSRGQGPAPEAPVEE